LARYAGPLQGMQERLVLAVRNRSPLVSLFFPASYCATLTLSTFVLPISASHSQCCLFHSEDGGIMALRNVGILQHHYTVSTQRTAIALTSHHVV